MSLCKKIYNRICSDKTFYLSFLPSAFIIFVIAYLILLYPETASSGVADGIELCLKTVIPSLFPFLVISNIAYDCGFINLISGKTGRFTEILFRLPAISLPIIIMSMLGGYPVGSLLIAKAFEKKQLSRSQAERMIMFCVNPGPAFVVSTVGCSFLGSKQSGVIIYISLTITAILMGVLSRFLADDTYNEFLHKQEKTHPVSSSVITESVNNSTRNMLNICIWIVVFSCFGELLPLIVENKASIIFLTMVSEVTNGAMIASEKFTLPIITAVIAFAGFCVHLQIMPCLLKIKLKYKYFLSVRILNSAFSCVVTFIITELFPQYSQVISLGAKPHAASNDISIPICVWLMIMCGLHIIGDSYIFNKKHK